MSFHFGLHHARKRLGPLAKARSWALVRATDTLAYVVSFLSLLFTLDQVRIIWFDHYAGGVSLLSWTFYTLSSAVWAFYGYLHRDRIILITNLVWVAFSLFIVVGVALY